MNKLKLSALALSVALLGCAAQAKDEQNIEVIKADSKAKVIWQSNDDSQVINLEGVDLNDPVALEQALSALPEEKRKKVIALFSQTEDGKLHIVSGTDGLQLQGKKMVIALEKDSDAKMVSHKVIKLHQTGEGGEFELVKTLLENAKLSKEQLQQLQALLDSKH